MSRPIEEAYNEEWIFEHQVTSRGSLCDAILIILIMVVDSW